MLIQHLGRSQVEILLRDVYSSLPEGEHARFRAHTLQLSARAAVHLFGNLFQVDAAREIHAAGVDAEDVSAGFDTVWMLSMVGGVQRVGGS